MAGLSDAASELESIARHLREIGDTDLLRELTRRMRDAVEPVKNEIRAQLDDHLPNRYAATLDGDLRIGISVRTNERNPGVDVNGTPLAHARKLRRLDEGRITHPLFADREHWYTQDAPPSMRPGWFSGPCEDAAPRVLDGIERGLADIEAKATRKGP